MKIFNLNLQKMRTLLFAVVFFILSSFTNFKPICERFEFNAVSFKGNEEPLEWMSDLVYCVVVDWDGKEGISIIATDYVEQYNTTSVERTNEHTIYKATDSKGKSGYTITYSNDLNVFIVNYPNGILFVLSTVKF
jgi:hypothetical protein